MTEGEMEVTGEVEDAESPEATGMGLMAEDPRAQSGTGF